MRGGAEGASSPAETREQQQPQEKKCRKCGGAKPEVSSFLSFLPSSFEGGGELTCFLVLYSVLITARYAKRVS